MNTESTNNTTADNTDAADVETAIVETVEAPIEVEEVIAPAAPTQVAKPAAHVSPSAVVGTGDRDDVLLSRCVFKSVATRKSLSVHHLQRRLVELGYPDAGSDKDGWYGDLTRMAVGFFQADHNLAGDGIADAVTLTAIFDGDNNVTVVLD
jgi:hypothetical protein